MPHKQRVPAYGCHKATGQAIVRLSGRDNYLGKYGSAESHDKYQRLIAEWRLQQVEREGQRRDATLGGSAVLRTIPVEELIFRYWQFAKTYYVKDGRPSKELLCMKDALRPLRKLYGSLNGIEFGPLALKALRQWMVDSDLSRGVVNARVNRIKRFFKWCVAEELIPASIYEGLRCVAGLRFGRTAARETAPVRPVDDVWVEAVLPLLSPQVKSMVEVQRLTGMRPCEVTLMRACDIDRSSDVWVYEPHDHKNRWRGHRRLVPIGPKSQDIIRPFLSRPDDSYLFSPTEAEAWRNQRRRQNRVTPMTPSQAVRHPKPKPKKQPRDHFDVDSYRRAISYGIKRANKGRAEDKKIPSWFPLQLRHSRATEIRRLHGIEAAQVSLGHAHASITEVYAERNLELALKIAKELG